MTVLLVADTALLALVIVLVAGLLRSHAEILARLGPVEASDAGEPNEVDPNIASPANYADEQESKAPDIQGKTLDGKAVQYGLGPGGRTTLLAFLTSGCLSCEGFWKAFGEGRDLPGGARLIVVTKDSSHESPSRLRKLREPGVAVVMSSNAWNSYEAVQAPFFAFVDGRSGTIKGVGSAGSWEQLLSLLNDAVDDIALGESLRVENRRAGRQQKKRLARAERARKRAERAQRELAAAGITNDHPSLEADPFDPGTGPAADGDDR